MTDTDKKFLFEAVTRLGEISAIVESGLLSGKGKMEQLSALISNYDSLEAYCEAGEVTVSPNLYLYFGESREFMSLKGLVPKVTLKIETGVYINKHTK